MVVGPAVPVPLGAAVEALRQLFDAAACSVALVDENGAELEFVAADGAGAEHIVGQSVSVGRGIAGWAAMSGQPIAVRDVQSDARFARDVAESTAYIPRTILAAPMFDRDGDVLGVVSVLDPAVEETSDWVLRVLGTAAGLIALVVVASPSATPDASQRLDLLGRDVLRTVEQWQAGEGSTGVD
jgi:signal transduction protein with GAF and PtsI domain